MKLSKMLSIATVSLLVTASVAAAADDTSIPECHAPFMACKAAGYVVGAHKKGDKEGADNGLWVDCISAVADGKKQVPGLDVTSAQACKAAKKLHKKSK